MCFVCGWKFQLLVIFTRYNGKKQYANLVPLKFLARYVEVHDKTRTSSYQKVKNIWKRAFSIKSKTRVKLATLQEAGEKKVSGFKVSELVTPFSISSPGSLVFKIVLMTMRVFFVVNTVRKARDPGTLSYQLTDNFNSKKKTWIY